jgi:hypothetical protein
MSTVENHGIFISSGGTLEIKDGISYHEHNAGDFENLKMYGGDLDVHGLMKVKGMLYGQVRDVAVGQDALLLVNDMNIERVRNLNIHQDGRFHTTCPWDANVTGSYSHAGQLSSGDSLNLNIACGLSGHQPGILIAPNGVQTEVARFDPHKSKSNAPALLNDPAIASYLQKQSPKVDKKTKEAGANLDTDELRALKAAYHKKKGYKGDEQPIWDPARATLSRKQKQITYIDFFLNTITYHYMNGRLTDITETGYIWQKREKQEEDLPEAYSPEIQRLMDILNAQTKSPTFMISTNAQLLEKAKKNREYNTKLLQELRKAGASNGDIDTLYNDPIMEALRNLKNMNDAQQDELFSKRPEIQDLSEYADDARDHIGLERYMDSPVKRFIDDVVIPLAILGSILAADIMAPVSIPATVPAAIVAAGRLAIPVGRVAKALGATEIYRELTNFFKKIEGDKSGKDSGASKDRIQSTKQDADKYINGLTDQKGVIQYKGRTQDGYEYYEFMNKCNYNGVRFRKGDYISRDTLHHEWEWFSRVKQHKGAIESVTGKLRKNPVSGRVLNAK